MNKIHILLLHTREKTHTIEFTGAPFLKDVLQEQGVTFAHPCGGRGVCLKCAVEARGAVSPPDDLEEKSGVRLSCRMRLLGNCDVTLHEGSGFSRRADLREAGSDLLLAADIGTTTLDIKLFDGETGEPVAERSSLNPQVSFAADVIGRVTAALEGKGGELRNRLLETLGGMIAGFPPVRRAVITGNTVMLYLLTGRNPKALAFAPFEADCLFGFTEELLGFLAYLPRCTGAFTGADLTCAVLSSGMTERADTSLLCDVGTNGELALWHRGTLYVASTAVGPAFEGAGISCGMGGVPGAIDKVWAANNALDYHVLGGGTPAGICGSGLIDAVAALLRLRILDSSGALDGDSVKFVERVALTRQDIRQVQLAKAAVAAGIETLLHTAGVSSADVHTLYIAGGFGSHLDVRSAAAIGLIPRLLAPRAVVLGNAALSGACDLLLRESLRATSDRIALSAAPVQLSGHPFFAGKFLEHMNF